MRSKILGRSVLECLGICVFQKVMEAAPFLASRNTNHTLRTYRVLTVGVSAWTERNKNILATTSRPAFLKNDVKRATDVTPDLASYKKAKYIASIVHLSNCQYMLCFQTKGRWTISYLLWTLWNGGSSDFFLPFYCHGDPPIGSRTTAPTSNAQKTNTYTHNFFPSLQRCPNPRCLATSTCSSTEIIL